MTISISGITTGLFAIFSSLIEKNAVLDSLEKSFPILKECQLYGLDKISLSFPLDEAEYRNDFINSNTVSIVMNDAKAFISGNNKLIEERLVKKNNITNFIILDYKKTDLMTVLTEKNGHKDDYYAKKIEGVIDYDLKNLKRDSSHVLNTYLNANYTTMAILLSDNYAMISLFRVSSGKDNVPHIVFRKGGSEYQKIWDDINKLCSSNCRKISNSNT